MRYIVILLVALVVTVLVAVQNQPVTSTNERVIRYSVLATNSSNLPVENAPAFLFAPGSGYSPPLPITGTHSFTQVSDPLLNSILRFALTLPPFGKQLIALEARVPERFPSSMPDPKLYLRAEPLIEVDSPEIREAALPLKRKSAEESARAVFEWVKGAVKDSGFHTDDRGALWALRERQGDCTEFTSLSAALLRSLGIPARRVGGFVMPDSGVVKPARYHNWTEFYDRSEWRILDAQQGVFDEAKGYVPFRILGSGEGTPLPNSHRFISADPRIELTLE